MRVLYSDGDVRELKPEGTSSRHFWATVAGLGLTGIIVDADLQLEKVSGNFFEVREVRSPNLEHLLSELKAADALYDHTVAWIDLSGAFKGRGVVGMGNFAKEQNAKFGLKNRQINFPISLSKSLITPLTVRAFNSIWYNKPLKVGGVSINGFTHPLDGIGAWNRVYGKRGFLQYQFSIPDGEEDFLYTVLGKLREIKGSSFLGVLKRFGKASLAPLSFPSPGWTLALDFPVGIPNLENTLISFDEEIASRNGRIYLVKDSRLRAEFLAKMYPLVSDWRQVRDEMDPTDCWKSDQGRRLGLC
jgi:decaprenylphospho-beta-D-ribofuranose 2-oxidase